MTEQEWKRRMAGLCFLMLPVGVLLMGIGAVLAGRERGMTGYTVGAIGVTLFVLGALFGKFAMWGPVPDSVRRQQQ